MKDILPRPVFASLYEHLIKAARRAERGFLSCEEDEDCVTRDLFRSLRRA
jgi:hypothetical protein